MAFMDFTRTALKNLFSKPATRQYPQVPREYPAFSVACAAASAPPAPLP